MCPTVGRKRNEGHTFQTSYSEQCGVLLCHQMHEQLCFAEWHSENLLEIEPLSVLLQLF